MSNTLTSIDQINPKLSSKFSPNLYRWMGKYRQTPGLIRVYRDLGDRLWIGYFDGDGFSGSRIWSVLCNGRKACDMAYTSNHTKELGLKEVDGFWPEYLRIGRCAIDPDHKRYFTDDDKRWLVNGDHRTCLWCGAKQHKEALVRVTREYVTEWKDGEDA